MKIIIIIIKEHKVPIRHIMMEKNIPKLKLKSKFITPRFITLHKSSLTNYKKINDFYSEDKKKV